MALRIKSDSRGNPKELYLLFVHIATGLIATFVAAYVIFLENTRITEETYRNNLEQITRNIETQFPVLKDPQYIRNEGSKNSDIYWALSKLFTTTAKSFKLKVLYYVISVDPPDSSQRQPESGSAITEELMALTAGSAVFTENVIDETEVEDCIFLLLSENERGVFPEAFLFEPYSKSFIDDNLHTVFETKNPYLSKNDENTIWGESVTYFRPVFRYGQVVGVIGAEFDISYIDGLTNRLIFVVLKALPLIFIIIALSAVANYIMERRLHKKLAINNEELQKQKLIAESASNAKSNFLASMSHEIRTPMNAIIGMSDLMRTDNLDDKQKSALSDIRKMGRALVKIINNILDISKIESGKMELVNVHYDFPQMCVNVVSMCGFQAAAKNLQFQSSISDNIPQVLYGDETRVRQIFTNIINNAIKYTRKGTVRVDAELEEHNGKSCIKFSVSDTGIGIKSENLDKLFGAFEQFDMQRNRGIVGSGLGLAITKSFVELMDGEIKVDSVYEKGTTFTVYIPVTEGDPKKIESIESAAVVIAKNEAKVLVVDDNSINLTVALGYLANHNIKADTAMSGAEAIQKIQETRYDLVFMDHMMPEMDGTEVAKAIRSMYSNSDSDSAYFRELPIVALSANAVEGARELFLACGMNDFISKPIEAMQLNIVLLKWLPPNKIDKTISRNELLKNQQKSDVMSDGDELTIIFSALNKIKILDTRIGISHVANDRKAYIDLLRQFFNEIEKLITDLQASLANEDWKLYTVQIHGIKTNFANIGVESIRSHAYELEMAGKNGDIEKIQKETEIICQNILDFKRSLSKTPLMQTEKHKTREKITPRELKMQLDELRSACENADSLADKIAAKLETVTATPKIDALLDEIASCVLNMDYDIAVKKIDALVDSLKKKKEGGAKNV